jgi:hypothetical protein
MRNTRRHIQVMEARLRSNRVAIKVELTMRLGGRLALPCESGFDLKPGSR